MNNEHNPIAQLITKIQQKWWEEITPDANVKLIRLLINPEESDLYRGFLKIESSANGKLPELFVVFLNPFNSAETYSHELIKAWFESYDQDQKTFEQMRITNPTYSWNDGYYRKKISANVSDADNILLEMLSSFHSALQMPGRKLTLTLMPYTIGNTGEYKKWLDTILKIGIPDHIQFCIIDYVADKYFEGLFTGGDDMFKTLMVNLDLDGAVNKIIEAGDPNSPEVQLRKCMLKMNEAVASNNLGALDHWGQTCIDLMTRSKIKSLMATAYIIYAAMLFHFKKHPEIEMLLQKGLKITRAGISSGDNACKPLEMQFFGFMAANYQLNKKNKEAVEWYCKQAELSIKSSLPMPAINAYWQASNVAKKNDPFRYTQILEHAYKAGEDLGKEELEYSQYCTMTFDYYNLLLNSSTQGAALQIDTRMNRDFGSDWKEKAQQKIRSLQKNSSMKNNTAYVTGQ